MNKIIAALIASTFSLGAFAQASAPASKPATVPGASTTAAAPAPDMVKKETPVKKTKAKAKKAKKAKKAASAV